MIVIRMANANWHLLKFVLLLLFIIISLIAAYYIKKYKIWPLASCVLIK